jgi:hypothetical protein
LGSDLLTFLMRVHEMVGDAVRCGYEGPDVVSIFRTWPVWLTMSVDRTNDPRQSVHGTKRACHRSPRMSAMRG